MFGNLPSKPTLQERGPFKSRVAAFCWNSSWKLLSKSSACITWVPRFPNPQMQLRHNTYIWMTGPYMVTARDANLLAIQVLPHTLDSCWGLEHVASKLVHKTSCQHIPKYSLESLHFCRSPCCPAKSSRKIAWPKSQSWHEIRGCTK